jgi:predicted nucleotidyltransferase
VIRYGSRGRGDHRDRSDVDLAIDAPDLARDDWVRLHIDPDEASTLYGVDLIRLDETPDQLRQRIETEGVDV